MKNWFNDFKETCRVHSPEILMGVGIVGVVGTAVLAGVATVKAKDIIKKHKEEREELQINIDEVNKMIETGELEADKYTPEDARREKTQLYLKTAGQLTLNYAPALLAMGGTIASFCGAMGIMKNRYSVLSTAFASTTSMFAAYRKRVKEKFGEKVDKGLMTGKPWDDNGPGHEVTDEEREQRKEEYEKEKASLTEQELLDEAHRFWGYSSDHTPFAFSERDAEVNNLKFEVRKLNMRLKEKGHLFLNDAFKALGYEPTPAGQCLGWWDDPTDPSCSGVIDIGVTEEEFRDYVMGEENDILLTFNIDGDILSRWYANPYKRKKH